MRSGGGSIAHLGLYAGEDWHTWLSTYPDHCPILSIDVGSTSVSLSVIGNKATPAAVEFARELAGRMAEFAAETERLLTRDRDGGDGEAA